MRKRSTGEIVFDVFNYIFMIIVFIVMTYPFYYVLIYSLSDPAKLNGGLLLFPGGINFSSYQEALSNPDILNGLFISVARTVIGPLGMLLITSIAGFVMTKDELIGIHFFRKFFIFTMYFSSGLIPVYILIKSLHLTGTFAVYIIPGLVNAFNLVLIKTYIENLPKGLEDAALIDGANDITVFFKVIFPICLPVIAAISLFACVGQWNSFIDTQLYNAMDKTLYPIQYVLYNYLAAQTPSLEQAKQTIGARRFTPQTLKMAITVITVVPILMVYPFMQKYFASGLMIGAIKG